MFQHHAMSSNALTCALLTEGPKSRNSGTLGGSSPLDIKSPPGSNPEACRRFPCALGPAPPRPATPHRALRPGPLPSPTSLPVVQPCVPGNARVCGSGEVTAIWSLRHCKPAACILGLIGANMQISLMIWSSESCSGKRPRRAGRRHGWAARSRADPCAAMWTRPRTPCAQPAPRRPVASSFPPRLRTPDVPPGSPVLSRKRVAKRWPVPGVLRLSAHSMRDTRRLLGVGPTQRFLRSPRHPTCQ